ncbi:MAG TPA: hypothetical protein VIP77_18715 [Jiangellaceae bacterium]
MLLDGDAWQTFFDSFTREAFRLETLPVYTMPGEQEDLARFRRDGVLHLPADDPWLVRVRNYRETGRWIGRVHVLTRPLSDYLKYEMAFYAYSSGAGEDIRILDLTDGEDRGLPNQDFWLFDEETVVQMNYRSDGTQISRELLDSPDIGQYRQWKELALSIAVPFKEYIAA